jgi:DNA-binding response OmpR family regulator
MTKSDVLRDKTILAVDDEPDVLEALQELLREEADVVVHTATGFEQARQLLFSHNYDLAILDIMGVQGFDLLQIAGHKGVPAIMLTAHQLNPEALKRSIELGAKAYLPKTHMPDVVPFLEDVLRLQYRSVMRKAVEFVFEIFDRRLGSEWRKSEKEFWDDLEKNLGMNEPAIITKRQQEK